MLEEIDAATFAFKSRELQDREAELKLEIDTADRGRHEIIDLAIKAFELSQSLREQWFTADYAAKRRILEILCLNCSLVDVSLSVSMRKPFDLLAKGLILKESERQDLNLRPLRPERSALARLSYAPIRFGSTEKSQRVRSVRTRINAIRPALLPRGLKLAPRFALKRRCNCLTKSSFHYLQSSTQGETSRKSPRW